jgi:hypothetical protein
MNQIIEFARRFELLRLIKSQLGKGPIRNISDLFWLIHQWWRRFLLSLSSADKIQWIKSTLSEKLYADGSIVTVTFGSLKFGNRDNKLTLFLDSFLNFTHCPNRIEILIKVDDNDDLLFFYDIKCRYSDRVNLRFFSSPRGRGYEDMHIWHHDLIKHRNSAARLHFILTDDAVFEFKNWDDKLVSLLERRRDTYFIGTACSLEEATSFYGPNPVTPVPVYWIRGDDYPIYGFDLLCSAAKMATTFPGWNEFGNLQLVDQYAGSLLKIAWEKFGVNLHEQIDLYAARRGGNESWQTNPKRWEIRTRTLNKFHNAESEMQRQKIVQEILSDIKLNSTDSKLPH